MPGVKPSKERAEEEPQVLRQGRSDFNSEITDNLAQFTSQIWSYIFSLELSRQNGQIERDLQYHYWLP